MKKLFLAMMFGAMAMFTFPSCSDKQAATDDDDSATSEEVVESEKKVAPSVKLAEMELTADNKDEFVETFDAAVDELSEAIKAKDQDKVNKIGEKISKAMDHMKEAGDVLSDEEKMAMLMKLLPVAEEAQKAGINLD